MASAAVVAPTSSSVSPTDPEKELVVEDATKEIKKSVVSSGLEEKLLKHSHDADTAMKAFEGMEGQVIELSEEKSKALLRKIDMHLMPVSNIRLHSHFLARLLTCTRSCVSYTA